MDMLIDCNSCVAQGTEACDDCVVTYILHDGVFELGPDEAEAIDELCRVGLVPRLRLVPVDPPPLSQAG
jgi:hypothetical protein